jgi:hypothetical protein
MSTQRDHVDPLHEEIPTSSTGEEMDPKVLDLDMKIAERMFLKLEEEGTKKIAEEEESRKKAQEEESRRADEDRGKGKIEYNDDLVELLVSKVITKVMSTPRNLLPRVKATSSIEFILIIPVILFQTSLGAPQKASNS